MSGWTGGLIAHAALLHRISSLHDRLICSLTKIREIKWAQIR
jgi:hypothetical protein